MIIENAIGPTEEQIKEMQASGPEEPICLVNLLKYKENAEYPDGRATSLTGREAYELYAKAVSEMLTEYGGKMVFVGSVTCLRMGFSEDLWDEIAIVMYPSRSEMLRMTMSEGWRDVSIHRIAGLQGQLNIETIESESFPNIFK